MGSEPFFQSPQEWVSFYKICFILAFFSRVIVHPGMPENQAQINPLFAP